MRSQNIVSILTIIGMVSACASPPKAQTPSGKTRVPINNEATITAYSADAARQDADAKRYAQLQALHARQEQEVAALKAYIIEKESIDQINTPKGIPIPSFNSPKGMPVPSREKAEPAQLIPTPAKPQAGSVIKNPPAEKISAEDQPKATAVMGMTMQSSQDRIQIRDRSVMFTINHTIASTAFVPGDLDVTLLETVLRSPKIVIRGRTDAIKANPIDQRIAMGRANAAMRYLLAHGVPRDRIAVFFRSAGGFVTENLTPEGKARNRRVEIEAFDVDNQKVANQESSHG
jgi:flagellar motor protein MotB